MENPAPVTHPIHVARSPADTLPEPLESREKNPRVRKPIAEIAFAGARAAPLSDT